MTLQSLLNLLPRNVVPQSHLYCVKPPDEIDRRGTIVHLRQRFVAILPDGQAICSCLKGRHHGIPCRHFLAVLRKFRNHSFNMKLLHYHWQRLDKRTEALSRPDVYLPQTEYLREIFADATESTTIEAPTINAASAGDPSLLSTPPKASTPQTKAAFSNAKDTISDTQGAAPLLSVVVPNLLKRGWDNAFRCEPQKQRVSTKRENYSTLIDITNRLHRLTENSPGVNMKLHEDMDQLYAKYDQITLTLGNTGSRKNGNKRIDISEMESAGLSEYKIGTDVRDEEGIKVPLGSLQAPTMPARGPGRPASKRIESATERKRTPYKLASPKKTVTRGM